MDAVSYQKGKLLVGLQALPEILRVEIGERTARVVGPESIFIHVQQGVFRIVDKMLKAHFSQTASHRVKVVWTIITQKIRDRSIQIAPVEDHQHVIDQIDRIHQHRVIRIGRTIRVVPQDLLVRFHALKTRT